MIETVNKGISTSQELAHLNSEGNQIGQWKIAETMNDV